MHPPAQTPSPSWEFQFVQVIPYNPPSHKGIPCAQYAFASLPFSYSLNCMSVYWASSGDQYILLLPAAGTLLLPAPPCSSLHLPAPGAVLLLLLLLLCLSETERGLRLRPPVGPTQPTQLGLSAPSSRTLGALFSDRDVSRRGAGSAFASGWVPLAPCQSQPARARGQPLPGDPLRQGPCPVSRRTLTFSL